LEALVFKKIFETWSIVSQDLGLQEVADYWEQVYPYDDYQNDDLPKNIISTLYNNRNPDNKKIVFYGMGHLR